MPILRDRRCWNPRKFKVVRMIMRENGKRGREREVKSIRNINGEIEKERQVVEISEKRDRK